MLLEKNLNVAAAAGGGGDRLGDAETVCVSLLASISQ